MIVSRSSHKFLRSYFTLKPFRKLLKLDGIYITSAKRNYSAAVSSNVNSPLTELKNLRHLSVIDTYGQPVARTHPHMVKMNEVIPGITLQEIKDRRENLLESILKFSATSYPNFDDHIVIVPSAMKKFMSEKIPYVFRQNTEFLYLSGCLEPETVLVLTVNKKEVMESFLFIRPKDKYSELWDGPRTGVENAVEVFGVDEAFPVTSLDKFLKNKLSNQSTLLWYDKRSSCQPQLNHLLKPYVEPNTDSSVANDSPTIFMQKLRLIKSPAEIELMRKTCEVASTCLNEVIGETKVGDSEHHLYARMDFKCRMANASYLAYPPVVATGVNATTIHYINNNQIIKDGDMVLMDAGCEYAGYTSDITRTWPANGTFTKPQLILYDILYNVQQDLLGSILKTRCRTLDELFDEMCLKLGKYLQEAGLIKKHITGVELAKAAYSFCPHHVSHYLGMDVHDTPLISRTNTLLPGMVCTVEPGIYINSDRTDVPEEFRGVGLRIEDDILIKTEDTIEVLTKSCIKKKEELERRRSRFRVPQLKA